MCYRECADRLPIRTPREVHEVNYTFYLGASSSSVVLRLYDGNHNQLKNWWRDKRTHSFGDGFFGLKKIIYCFLCELRRFEIQKCARMR